MAKVSRFRAPIQYGDVRRSYNNVRMAGGGLIAAVAILAAIQGAASAPYVLAGGILLAIDAVHQRLRGVSALRPLLLDATILGTLSLTRGYSGGIEGAGFVYLVTGAVLLLPLSRAVAVLIYAALWSAPIALFGPLLNPSDDNLLAEVGAIFAFAGVVARLLYSTGQALFAAEKRHRDALTAEKRAVELKDEFVSMVSHELRTPLTSIVGFAGTLRDNWATLPATEVDEFLLIMRAEANHLANLVEDILVIPRLEAGRLRLEPETIALRQEAYEVAQIVFSGTTREIQVDVPADVHVSADPGRLRQIFRNLLENARKYGGDQVLITGERSGTSYKVVIADNGQGIPVEDRERIFEHFEQAVKGDARSEGVGLGLPIARKLTRAMGGDLWFEPRFPTGAQFLFTVQTAPDSGVQRAVDTPESDNITPIRQTG